MSCAFDFLVDFVDDDGWRYGVVGVCFFYEGGVAVCEWAFGEVFCPAVGVY